MYANKVSNFQKPHLPFALRPQNSLIKLLKRFVLLSNSIIYKNGRLCTLLVLLQQRLLPLFSAQTPQKFKLNPKLASQESSRNHTHTNTHTSQEMDKGKTRNGNLLNGEGARQPNAAAFIVLAFLAQYIELAPRPYALEWVLFGPSVLLCF